MLVIEGYAGKSLEVAKYIDTLENQDVLIITNDKLALSNVVGQTKNNIYFTEQSNIRDIKDIIRLNGKLRHIIFYMNTTEEDIKRFKQLEVELGIKSVLTVQTHDRENPREVVKYFV